MRCKIIDGPVDGIDGIKHQSGEVVDLCDADAKSLATWGIVQILEDDVPATVPTAPVQSSAPVGVPDNLPTATVPDTVPAVDTTATTAKTEVPADTGSADDKAKAKAK